VTTDNLFRGRCVEVIETERDTCPYDRQRLRGPPGRFPGRNQPQKILENKKMNRSELMESVAGYVAGITTGFAFVLLYVMLATPVVETVEKFIA
jgi:hypothetical protein